MTIFIRLNCKPTYDMHRLLRNVCLILCWLMAVSVSAQRIISGTVFDENKEPLTGATVSVKEKVTLGTTTDTQGKYMLKLPDNREYTLQVSYMGYISQTHKVSVSKTGKVDFILKEDAVNMETVVVTGTRTPKLLKDVPIVTRVITADEIKKVDATHIGDLLQAELPGIEFSYSMDQQVSLNMQGFGGNAILFLVDGERLAGETLDNIDYNRLNMDNVERIEIVKGAASSLYGSDAIGGVINIITNEPKDVVAFSSNSSYTRKNQFSQGLNLDIAQGKIGSYTSYKYDHSDGWQNSHLTEDGEDIIETIAPLSLGYSSNNFSQKFTYDATDQLSFYANGGYYNRGLERPVEREDITGGSKYNTTYEGYNWGAGAKYKLSKRNVIQFDYSGNNYASRYKYLIENSGYLPGQYALTKLQKFHDAELKGIFGFTTNSTTVFGVDYRREVLRRPDSDLDKSVYTTSAYGQHEVKLWNHLTGVVGVRYDHHEQTGGRFTPKVAAMYNIGNFNVRATYAAGFRAPGIDELYYHMFKKTMGTRATISLGDENLDPERSNYYSINMEYRTNRFSASVTGYLNYVKNMVTSKSTKFDDLPEAEQNQLREEFPEIGDLSSTKNLSVKNYFNFEKATVKGFEVNLNGNLFPGFTLTGNYTYAYGRGLNEGGEWQNIERSIRHTATITGNYTHSWSDYTLNLNLNGRLQSKVYYPGDADGNAPGYGIWNLNTRHTFDGFRNFVIEPGIGIDNIFNKKDNRPLNKNFALYSPGRSVVISLALRLK